MLAPLESEPFQTYAVVAVGTIVLGSHGTIFLLNVLGLLLKPFWRQPAAFLYPWVYLWGEPPSDIASTPFRPSRLLLIHALWLCNSVGLWVVFALETAAALLAALINAMFGIDFRANSASPLSVLVIFAYSACFAVWSSWMWSDSLRRSLASFRYANVVENSGSSDDPAHYLAPFRKATWWALATLPIYIGWGVLSFFLLSWEG